jgi:RNA polymerase-binding transcription factor DksA
MNSHLTTQATNSTFVPAGATWAQLHSEREEVCAALLDEANDQYGLLTNLTEAEPSAASTREMEWRRRELLQARLRQIDDALDRLISGSYGHCSDCGKPIEERRLAADSAVANCLKCQRLDERGEPELVSHTL